MHKFIIDAGGSTGAEIEYLLRRYGVQMLGGWGLTAGRNVQEDGTVIEFSVRETQARWTTHILSRAGYAILAGATRDGIALVDGTLPRPWGAGVGAGDTTGRLVDFLDALLLNGANRRTAAAMVQRKARRRNRARGGGMWNTIRRLW